MAGPSDRFGEVNGEGENSGFLSTPIGRRRFLQYGLGGAAALAGSTLLGDPAGASAVRQIRQMVRSNAATPKTLTVAAAQGSANLDPNLLAGLACGEVWSLCYDTMFHTSTPASLSAAEADLADFQPIPLLVTSWTPSKADSVWRFTLNPKAKSSAGSLFSPADIIYSAQRHLALQVYGGIFLNRVGVTSASQFTADGDHAVLMTLPQGIDPSYMLQLLGNFLMPIYDSKTFKAHATTADPWSSDWAQQNTAGFGPYVISSRSGDGTATVLTARKDYYSNPVIPKVIWNQTTDSGTQLELLLRGAAQLTDQLSPEQIATVRKHPSLAVTPVASAEAAYLGFNNSQAPFNDINFHKGLAHAIDRTSIVNAVWKGTAQPMDSILPPWFQAATSKYWTYNYDVAKATALLAPYAKAGLQLQYNAGLDLHQTLAELIEGALAAAGMTIELDGQDATTYQTNESNATNTWWIDNSSVPLICDSLYALQLLFLTKPTQILLHYSNPNVDAAVAKLEYTKGIAEQDKLIDTAQKYIMADLPIIPIAYSGSTITSAKDLVGFRGYGANFLHVSDLSFT